MPEKPDITVTLPAEYFDALSVVIATGLKQAGINPLIRNELRAWWTAEKEIIEEGLNGE
jgi:hypothetical protein